MTASAQTRVGKLKFANEHIDAILAGRKTATIRYDLDLQGRLEIGRRFRLLDEDGQRFASAIVDDRGYMAAERIVEAGVEGHESYASMDEFLEEMREYYPRAELGPDTCFDIIRWQRGELWE